MHRFVICCLFIVAATTGVMGDQTECNQRMERGSGNGNQSFLSLIKLISNLFLGNIRKFFYHPKWRTCFEFDYSGEGGNSNRFDLFSDCMIGCALGAGCNNECKCDNTHKAVERKCSPPDTAVVAIACQAWYLRCPEYQPSHY